MTKNVGSINILIAANMDPYFLTFDHLYSKNFHSLLLKKEIAAYLSHLTPLPLQNLRNGIMPCGSRGESLRVRQVLFIFILAKLHPPLFLSLL